MSKIARRAASRQEVPANKTGSPGEGSKKGSQRQPVFEPSDWVTKAEAARIRRVTRQAIAKLVAKGKFQTLEIAGRTLLKRSEVQAYQSPPGGRPAGS